MAGDAKKLAPFPPSFILTKIPSRGSFLRHRPKQFPYARSLRILQI
jgi:hypothetical protein